MRIAVVTGGRDYADRTKVEETLKAFNPHYVIEGGCDGADRHAYDWARRTIGVCAVQIPALWERDRRAAGPLRNQAMMMLASSLNADSAVFLRVFAFPGGRGTANAVAEAQLLNLSVTVIQ